MIDKREGTSKKPAKSQDSYFNDAPAMPTKNVPGSQKKAPKQPFTD